jgi:cytoskeletal protein CcmA (bactofilin family)
MAENPKPEEEVKDPAATPDTGTAATPAPSNLTADALSDGTVPTVLSTGDGIGTSIKPLVDPNKRRVTSIYRRADITTSIITMIATLAIIGIIFGGYLFLNKSKKIPTPKVTTLDQSEITKLGGFLGNNIGSGAGQILTISSSSLLKGRVAIDNDLKVTGNTEIGGATTTSDLTVTKTTNLNTTNIKANLTVIGTTTMQGPAILAGGATIGQNLAVAGNGTFGGALSAGTFNAKTLTVSGDITLDGHLIIAGALPTVTADVGAGTGAKATVEGTDSAGTIIITTGTVGTNSNSIQTNGILTFVNLKFRNPYTKTPHVLLTAVGYETGQIGYYVLQTATGFTIQLNSPAKSASSYAYNYWVIQ